jgi:hypothetical protein
MAAGPRGLPLIVSARSAVVAVRAVVVSTEAAVVPTKSAVFSSGAAVISTEAVIVPAVAAVVSVTPRVVVPARVVLVRVVIVNVGAAVRAVVAVVVVMVLLREQNADRQSPERNRRVSLALFAGPGRDWRDNPAKAHGSRERKGGDAGLKSCHGLVPFNTGGTLPFVTPLGNDDRERS